MNTADLVFMSFSVFFFRCFLRERAKNKSRQSDISYITEQIGSTGSAAGTDDFAAGSRSLLIPTELSEIRELAAALNRLSAAMALKKTEYERSRRATAQMLTNISHDLRTPLTVLSGCSELLKKQATEAERTDCCRESGKDHGRTAADVCELSERIRQKTREMIRTVDEYFTLSRLESGDLHLVPERIDLAALCREILLDYYDILEGASFTVHPEIGPAPVFTDADPDAVRRILKNLIDNAIRHGGIGNYLGLRLTARDGYATIDVEDHGPGILKEDQENIFSRNYSTAHRACGSGLGLTISRNLARQMQGELSVLSEPGRGSVFSLTFREASA